MLNLQDVGVDTEIRLPENSIVELVMKDGQRMEFRTPLFPEDVMALWNSWRPTIKLVASGLASYVVIRKRRVSFLKVSLVEAFAA